jgi:hypothetical protein
MGGMSTFAGAHFLTTEVLSSDFCRGLVSDDENDQAATKPAFELLHFIASKRMAAGRLTVVDATNVKREDRAPLVALARKYHFLPVAIVFNMPERLCQDRNRGREGPLPFAPAAQPPVQTARYPPFVASFGPACRGPARVRRFHRDASGRLLALAAWESVIGLLTGRTGERPNPSNVDAARGLIRCAHNRLAQADLVKTAIGA